MDSTENSHQPAPAYHDQIARVTVLEKAVMDLQCENAVFRQRMDSNFESLRASLAQTKAEMRAEFQTALHAMEQSLLARMQDQYKELGTRIDRLEARVDFLAKWLVGTQVTTLAFVIATAGHAFSN